MTVYLDRIRLPGRDLDFIVSPTTVSGIEIYPRGAGASAGYQLLNGTCGVVLVWTK
jgi:hypothetical protein